MKDLKDKARSVHQERTEVKTKRRRYLTQTLEELKSPPDGGWTDKEIEVFSRRAERFRKAGMEDMEAERLAQQMFYRDRPDSGDDRRICVECRGFTKGKCTRGFSAIWNILQRCDGFAMRGAA